MVKAFKVYKDMNEISLEELISALRSHEIELDEFEPQKKGKSIALKSTKKKVMLIIFRLKMEALKIQSQKKMNFQ